MKPETAKRHLRSALRKSNRFDGDVWCACLIPVEIVALTGAGYLPSGGSVDTASRAPGRVAIGDGYPRWYYFHRPGGLPS